MKSKIASLIGAAMLFGMSSLGARADVTVKWSTSLTPGSHPESVYYDKAQKVLYVSNIVGGGTDIDGNGYIARMSLYGQVLPGPLVTGLNGPKGMVMSGRTLWVSDINRLVEVDTRTGAKRFYDAPGSVFLNDTAVDDDGNVYVSDIATRKIWRLKNGQMAEWVNTPLNPNGLLFDDDSGKLVVAG
jgi:DNA-binding beta-propeller fold protein YncE